MGVATSSNNYINANRSQFISPQQLNNILKEQKSTDIYQSQIGNNMYQSNASNDQYNLNLNTQHHQPQNFNMNPTLNNNYRQNVQQNNGYSKPNQFGVNQQQYPTMNNNYNYQFNPYNNQHNQSYPNQINQYPINQFQNQTQNQYQYQNQNNNQNQNLNQNQYQYQYQIQNQYQNQYRNPNSNQGQYVNNPQSSPTQYLKKVISFTQGSQSIEDYLNTLNKIGKQVECQNLYLPILCKVSGQQTNCSDYRKLEMYYQNYDVRVTDQIAARKRQRQYFAEQQVWYILYSILNACRKFQKFSMSSGNLKTQHILLNDKGHIKVINKLSYPRDQKDGITPFKQQDLNQKFIQNQSRYSNNSDKQSDLKNLANCLNPTKDIEGYPKQFALTNNNNSVNYNQHNTSFISNNTLSSNLYRNSNDVPTFYSPQQLRIMRESIQKVVNHNISQTYSIGIIIFEICTFIPGQRVYDMNRLLINQHVLKRGQQIMNSKYSKLLNNLVKTMLSNAYDRPLPSQIYSAFKPYEKRILNLKPFKFDISNLRESLPISQVSTF